MKKFVVIFVLLFSFLGVAQDNAALTKHYKAFYKEMKLQGDINGVINALTHLNILEPSQQRRDTLAFVYMNNNQHVQALNTVGIEENPGDSDLALQVKAFSLQAINQPQRAIKHFQLLFNRKKDPYLAYEMADLKIQTGDTAGASSDIEFGIANATNDMKYAFYERQQPYEVSLKAAFLHMKGLAIFNQDKTKIDEAIALMDQALQIEPNFNLASLSKQALESRKTEGTTEEN